MRMSSLLTFSSVAAISLASCVNVHVDPIYAKVDVNIKVDQELDSFFDTVQKQSTTAKPAPSPAVSVPPIAPTLPETEPASPAVQPPPPTTEPAAPAVPTSAPSTAGVDAKVVPPPPVPAAPATAPASQPDNVSPSK